MRDSTEIRLAGGTITQTDGPPSRPAALRCPARPNARTASIAATWAGSIGHDVGVPLTISRLADRPDLVEAMWDMPTSWPEFMRHDPIGGLFYGNIETRFAEFVLVAQDEAGEAVACAYSVPFVLGDDELPDNGWDFVIRSGLLASLRDQEPDAISAVEIAVRPDRQGTGLSQQLLVAMRDNAARQGFAELVAPVRPNGKADVHEPMSTYAFRVREDGLPVDPWLRVHVRAGGRIARWPRARWSSPARSTSGANGPGCRSTPPAPSSCRRPSPRSTATSSTGSRRTSSRTCGSCTARD